MIGMDDFDVDEAHEWAIEDARKQGCTCASEPQVFVTNCDKHGIHLAHEHERRCVLSFFYDPRRPELLYDAWLN